VVSAVRCIQCCCQSVYCRYDTCTDTCSKWCCCYNDDHDDDRSHNHNTVFFEECFHSVCSPLVIRYFSARITAPGQPFFFSDPCGVTSVFPPFDLLSAVVSLFTADVIPLRMLVPSGVAATTIIMMMIAATTTTPYSSRNVFMGLFLLSQ